MTDSELDALVVRLRDIAHDDRNGCYVSTLDAAEGCREAADAIAQLRRELAEARALLKLVLACGLCEEPRGVGFTPSKQEKRAAELAQAISAALAKERT